MQAFATYNAFLLSVDSLFSALCLAFPPGGDSFSFRGRQTGYRCRKPPLRIKILTSRPIILQFVSFWGFKFIIIIILFSFCANRQSPDSSLDMIRWPFGAMTRSGLFPCPRRDQQDWTSYQGSYSGASSASLLLLTLGRETTFTYASSGHRTPGHSPLEHQDSFDYPSCSYLYPLAPLRRCDGHTDAFSVSLDWTLRREKSSLQRIVQLGGRRRSDCAFSYPRKRTMVSGQFLRWRWAEKKSLYSVCGVHPYLELLRGHSILPLFGD
ncbi:hypothetical protein CIHG_09261 [Coccidioides immitis H538.4]|uniref:Uncharacterized protein n=1 Tax=Coccidioides immitis H538.4 TaxID=396776 RepID=A0A0J8S568_COCIT|nr:hypothetical protein CIHG_09261 [Coccidioides immitis H538.4]